MAPVFEVDATKRQVLDFIVDCQRIEATFKDNMPTAESRKVLAEVKNKWKPVANGPGPRLSASGPYGDLLQAINQLPNLNQSHVEWFNALYDAQFTARNAARLGPEPGE